MYIVKRVVPAVVLLVLGVVVASSPANAEEVNQGISCEEAKTCATTTTKERDQQRKQEYQQKLAAQKQALEQKKQEFANKREAAKAKLDDAKKRVCQKHEAKINRILQNISDRSEKHLEVFKKIAERTKAFYEKKGRTIDNYDVLVAEVDTKQAAAEAAVDAIQSASVEFKCDGTDPKGAAQYFKESLETTKTALKEYKTAVKNLIVGVKSAQADHTMNESSVGGTQQ